MYTYIGGDIHRPRPMSHRTQVVLTDRQHGFLREESARTGLAMAELVRRAVDFTYRPASRPRIAGYELSVGLWRRPDPAIAGRRPPAGSNGAR